MTFGQKLKSLLKEHDMTQENLAEQLEVSRQAVGKWANDKGIPEVEKLCQISNLFGVTLDYLLKDEQTEAAQQNGGYYVSREMLEGFLLHQRQGAKRLVLGISCLILANLFTGSWRPALTLYWVATAVGIAVLVWHVLQPKRYKEISTKQLLFDDLVLKELRAENEKNRKRYVFMIIAGVLIFVLSPQITLLVANYSNGSIGNAVQWVLLAASVALFLLAGISMRAEGILARNADFILKKSKRRRYTFVYAALPITAVAVVAGVLTNVWSPVMPIIALFCVLLVTVCKLILEGREQK